MQLKHDSLLLKWAYMLTDEFNKPRAGMTINGCDVFWRAVLLTPIKLILVLGGVAFVIGFGPMITKSAWGLLVLPGLIAGIFLLHTIIVTVVGRICRTDFSVIREGWRGIKEGYCPRINVTGPIDDDDWRDM
jgi:hypothetical protein